MVIGFFHFPPQINNNSDNESDTDPPSSSSSSYSVATLFASESNTTSPSSLSLSSTDSSQSYNLDLLFELNDSHLSPRRSNSDIGPISRDIQAHVYPRVVSRAMSLDNSINQPISPTNLPSRIRPITMTTAETAYITSILRQRNIPVTRENIAKYGSSFLYRPL